MVRLSEIPVRTRTEGQPDQRPDAETALPPNVCEVVARALADALVLDYRQVVEAPVEPPREQEHGARKQSG